MPVPIIHCGTLAGAVDQASRSAAPGDTVLLAPACASFDQFQSYRASRPRLQRTRQRFSGGIPIVAQQVKYDWLLFGTTVAMVGFGLVMVYSASSVVAELNPHINSSFYYAGHQLLWAAVSFVALMYFKRRDYRMLQRSRLGLRIARHGAVPANSGVLPG